MAGPSQAGWECPNNRPPAKVVILHNLPFRLMFFCNQILKILNISIQYVRSLCLLLYIPRLKPNKLFRLVSSLDIIYLSLGSLKKTSAALVKLKFYNIL